MATLVDTGPLVALIDRSQVAHERCVDALPSLSPPLVTTWPCFTEAMYFLGKSWRKQAPLWNLVEKRPAGDSLLDYRRNTAHAHAHGEVSGCAHGPGRRFTCRNGRNARDAAGLY